MKLHSVVNAIHAEIVCGNSDQQHEVHQAFASDLMSDVLTIGDHDPMLITGLSNLQTIRTAEMADIRVIVLARDKKATKEMIELASENDIILLQTQFSVFKCCGILYQQGITPIY